MDKFVLKIVWKTLYNQHDIETVDYDMYTRKYYGLLQFSQHHGTYA